MEGQRAPDLLADIPHRRGRPVPHHRPRHRHHPRAGRQPGQPRQSQPRNGGLGTRRDVERAGAHDPEAVVDHDLVAAPIGPGDDNLRGRPLAVDHAIHPAVPGRGKGVGALLPLQQRRAARPRLDVVDAVHGVLGRHRPRLQAGDEDRHRHEHAQAPEASEACHRTTIREGTRHRGQSPFQVRRTRHRRRRQPRPPVFPNLSLELDEMRRAGGGVHTPISRDGAVHGPSTPAVLTAGHGAALLPCSLDSDRLRRFRRSWRNAHAADARQPLQELGRAGRPDGAAPRPKGSRRLPKAVDGSHVVASTGQEVAEGSRRLPKAVSPQAKVSRTAPHPHGTTRHGTQSHRGQGEPHGTAPARRHPGRMAGKRDPW